VLLRNSDHNKNTWGLPGGNAEEGDGGDLLATAEREAREEMKVGGASSRPGTESPRSC
jgi:ADP-ribose pyrophosphatase YjhB (NUDIX family)